MSVRKSGTAGHLGTNLCNNLNECHIITGYYSKLKYMLRTQLKHCHSFSLAFYKPEYSWYKINENTLGKANSFSVSPKVSQSSWAATTIKKKNKRLSYRMIFPVAIVCAVWAISSHESLESLLSIPRHSAGRHPDWMTTLKHLV